LDLEVAIFLLKGGVAERRVLFGVEADVVLASERISSVCGRSVRDEDGTPCSGEFWRPIEKEVGGAGVVDGEARRNTGFKDAPVDLAIFGAVERDRCFRINPVLDLEFRFDDEEIGGIGV
jgi:hypothetical protein